MSKEQISAEEELRDCFFGEPISASLAWRIMEWHRKHRQVWALKQVPGSINVTPFYAPFELKVYNTAVDAFRKIIIERINKNED